MMELTTVEKLIEELKKLPAEAEVYVLGTQGYMHVLDDDGDVAVCFDDNEEID